jgi:phosphoglycolate phosphatase
MSSRMSDFPFDIVGFDLDGTLLDTSGDLSAATNHALALAGRPPLSIAQIRPMVGFGAKHMLEQGLMMSGGLPEDGVKPLYRALLAYYEANITVYTRPFAGAEALLDQFDALGVKYGVVTNKFESLAVKALTELDLTKRMAFIIGGDTLGKDNAKPSPAPIHEMVRLCGGGRAVFIGDSIYDTMAARAANIPSVAVSFGFLHQPIEELGADAVIDHFDELIAALKNMAA